MDNYQKYVIILMEKKLVNPIFIYIMKSSKKIELHLFYYSINIYFILYYNI